MSLKEVVEGSETRAGRIFDTIITAAIFLSIGSFSLETLPELSAKVQSVLQWTEVGCVGLFTVEYLLRFIVAERKSSFVFSVYGLIDLVAIVPFYVSLGVDLRSIRLVRLLRLLRILKLARYTKAIDRLRRAVLIAREELLVFLGIAGIVIYLSAVGIYYFENAAQPEVFASVFHSLWWSVVTLTTVGYGDVYPITLGGRVFTVVVVMAGLGMVGVPTGLIASALASVRAAETTKTI
ncbi:MAG: voltage-gated potassium channel [Acidobacteria bacterium]|nr:voltage-gated potassium channel [Acidobacteriota bacterium]|tara:strand:- start:1079 stop:1789 length:711 start_codon:yes stop_codon:yes gene_type:complete